VGSGIPYETRCATSLKGEGMSRVKGQRPFSARWNDQPAGLLSTSSRNGDAALAWPPSSYFTCACPVCQGRTFSPSRIDNSHREKWRGTRTTNSLSLVKHRHLRSDTKGLWQSSIAFARMEEVVDHESSYKHPDRLLKAFPAIRAPFQSGYIQVIRDMFDLQPQIRVRRIY